MSSMFDVCASLGRKFTEYHFVALYPAHHSLSLIRGFVALLAGLFALVSQFIVLIRAVIAGL